MNNLIWEYSNDGIVGRVKEFRQPVIFDPSKWSKNYEYCKKGFSKTILKIKKILANYGNWNKDLPVIKYKG